MGFWEMAYSYGYIEIDLLRQAVITDSNPFGDITKKEFEEISGEAYAA